MFFDKELWFTIQIYSIGFGTGILVGMTLMR